MHTAGLITQNKPNTDAELFFSAAGCVGGTKTAIGTLGFVGSQAPASSTNLPLSLNLSGLLLRTGMLQSQALGAAASQEAFGTAAATPGPSPISGTSGPSGYGPNSVVAPVLAANLPTLKGSVPGTIPKGIQINWIDFLYQVQVGAATSIGGAAAILNSPAPGLDVTTTQTQLIASTALSAVVNSNATTKIHRQRVNTLAPAFLITDATIIAIIMSITTPASNTVGWIGVILGCNYNFN